MDWSRDARILVSDEILGELDEDERDEPEVPTLAAAFAREAARAAGAEVLLGRHATPCVLAVGGDATQLRAHGFRPVTLDTKDGYHEKAVTHRYYLNARRVEIDAVHWPTKERRGSNTMLYFGASADFDEGPPPGWYVAKYSVLHAWWPARG